jgi:Flp pilus assembly protein TadD
MPAAHLDVAYLERARGRLDAAVTAAGKAFALRPGSAEIGALLATYLTESGRPVEALRVLEGFAGDDPPDLDVLTARGMALAASGRRDEALAVFARARQVDASNALVLVNVGTVYLQAGDTAAARGAFESALRLDAGVARAHNGLGVIAAQEGRAEDAVRHWGRAVDLNPRDYQALFNLGTTLVRLDRAAEARPLLEAYLGVAPPALEARDIARVREWLRH